MKTIYILKVTTKIEENGELINNDVKISGAFKYYADAHLKALDAALELREEATRRYGIQAVRNNSGREYLREDALSVVVDELRYSMDGANVTMTIEIETVSYKKKMEVE